MGLGNRLRPYVRWSLLRGGCGHLKERVLNTSDAKTWRDYADLLTPKQITILERWDAEPSHPDGPDAHRRGLISVALLFSECGSGRDN
jgi:hypothetical protein